MLTKMPKVGDVVRANSYARHMGDVTIGGEYEIAKVINSEARFEDDCGSLRFIDEDRFGYFTLKADAINEAHTAESVGSIEEIEFETTEVNSSDFCAKYHVISLTVDDVGLASVRNLARQSGKQSQRKHLQAKINELQKELDAL